MKVVCRLGACLGAGMRPHLVLTEEEKKERFKNLNKRRSDAEEIEPEDRPVTATPSAPSPAKLAKVEPVGGFLVEPQVPPPVIPPH